MARIRAYGPSGRSTAKNEEVPVIFNRNLQFDEDYGLISAAKNYTPLLGQESKYCL